MLHDMLMARSHELCDIEHNRKAISPKLAATYARKLGYSEEQFIRLAIQDIIDREGLNFSIEVIPKNHSNDYIGESVFA